MNRQQIALVWAFVIVLMAGAVHFGIVDKKAGQLMLLVLPVLAAIEIIRGDRHGCWPFKRKQAPGQ